MPFLREREALDTCINRIVYFLLGLKNLACIVERNFQAPLNCVAGVKLIIHPSRACLAVSVQTRRHLLDILPYSRSTEREEPGRGCVHVHGYLTIEVRGANSHKRGILHSSQACQE